MARKEKRNVRFDNRHVRLKTGETQKKNGYEYRWTTKDGKRHSIFATTLDALREMEADLAADQHDGIKTDIKGLTVNDCYNLWKELKRGIKDSTFKNYIYMYEMFVMPTFGKKRVVQYGFTEDQKVQVVAGIECDGYSYVSARTARDRDRLRSSVLKNMGWNLYRVWSAEWYKNPEIEGQKLVAFLQRAIRACDEKIKVLEEQKRKEEEAKRAELEKARAAREAEERRKQREQEAKEAKLRAEREEAERKRQEEAERKAAKLRADQEAAKKREEERRQAEEQRRRELELKRQLSDLSWVKPGVRVNHNRYGAGVVLSVAKDIIKVRFGQTEPRNCTEVSSCRRGSRS